MSGSTFALENQIMKKRITVSTKKTIYLIEPDKILYCRCNNSSTTLFLMDGESLQISKGLAAVEKLLKENGFENVFIRSHQSYLVNRNEIVRIDKTHDHHLILSNQEMIPISTRRRKEIMNLITIGA